MREVLFRCSGIGHIMGDAMQIDDRLRTPEVEEIIAKKKRTDQERDLIKSLKAATLSSTAKTYIRQMAAEDIFGVQFAVSSREMQKGIQCEDQSIALYNSVFGKSLTKNSERRTDEYLTGESDLPDVDEVADIKTAWSIATFPLSEEDVSDTQRKLYEWQVRAYMRLWTKPRGRVVYCLVDTPEDLCKWEDASLHMVSHIPDHMRVTTWTYDRDAELESQMIDKIRHARAYYAHVVRQFHETHQLCLGVGMHTITPRVEPEAPAAQPQIAKPAHAVSFMSGDPPMGTLADLHAADVAAQQVVDAEFREVGEPAPLCESGPSYIAPLVEPAEEATMRLGDVCERLGFIVNAQFVTETLRVPQRNTQGRAVLFYPSDFQKIVHALITHLQDFLP